MRDYDFNDTTSSYLCGANVAFDFCHDPESSNNCTQGGGHHGAGARSPFMGHDDRLTFLKMWPYDASLKGAVTFFEHPDCKGDAGIAWASDDVEGFAYYNKDDLWNNGVHIDGISALMVPLGYAVDMYDSASFGGDSFTVSGTMWLDNDLNMQCISILDTFDDRMASARVYRTGVMGSARGYWKSFTSTETMTFHTHQGFTTSESHEQQQT